MRGHIVKRGKRSYTIVVSLGTNPTTGRSKQQWVSIRGTKKDAEKRLAEILHQLDNGDFIKPTKTLLSEYLQNWLITYAKPKLSPRGFERYEGIIRRYLIPALGKIPLTHLRPEHLQQHYTECLNNGLNPNTVKYHHAVVHLALQTAVKWRLVLRNVADAVEPPKTHRTEMQTWNEEEIKQFLEGARGSPYYALFYTILYTGMRRSEVLALSWGAVDLILGQIYVNRSLHHLKDGRYVFSEPKSATSRRTISLPPSASLVLKEHHERQKLERMMTGSPLTDTDLVFGTTEGSPLRPNTVTRAWQMLAARIGIKVIRLHDARHTHASMMLKQGTHPKIVQERLGHYSIQMTLDTYSHVVPGLQEAAAVAFDKLLSTTHENKPAETSH